MRLRPIALLSVFLLTVFAFGGCTRSGEPGKQAKDDFTIVTSFYPMYISTINITKGIQGVSVINMTKPQTGCLHDYQLTPQDLKTLEAADAFVINGAGMESFIDKVISQQKNLQVIEASKGIELIKDENGEGNPHVWVAVSNAIIQIKNISKELERIDPKNASKYNDNANEYIKKLEALKQEMHTSLSGIKTRDIITFHEAFPYFAKEFSLNIVAVVEREPGTSPSPKELEDTVKIIKDSNIKALFAEPQYSAKVADTIAQETGAKVYALDPAVTGDAKPDAYDAYIDIMKHNLSVLEEALG